MELVCSAGFFEKMDLPALQKLAEEQFNALLSYRSALVKAEELGFDGLTEVEFSEIQQKQQMI